MVFVPEMTHFDIFLFSTDTDFIRQAVAAGVDGITVDWERIGKHERQANADTQINADSLDDLRAVRAATGARVTCRINSYGATTAAEIDEAVAAGADEILLPMVRSVAEVEAVLGHARGRCGVGILIETLAATRLCADLARLPLSRVYLGLNDLAIERGTRNIFAAVTDGIVERVREAFHAPFGFAGLTLPDAGFPIPCRLLIGEMARLACQFSFLRRSFHRDIQGRDLAVEIPRLRAAIEAAQRQPQDALARNRAELTAAIAAWPDGLPQVAPSFAPHGRPAR
jgi:hypothetical protein